MFKVYLQKQNTSPLAQSDRPLSPLPPLLGAPCALFDPPP